MTFPSSDAVVNHSAGAVYPWVPFVSSPIPLDESGPEEVIQRLMIVDRPLTRKKLKEYSPNELAAFSGALKLGRSATKEVNIDRLAVFFQLDE